MRIARRIVPLLAATLTAGVLVAPASAATLYTAEGSVPAVVNGYAIGANGSLTLIPGAAEGTEVFPRYAVVTPDAKHLYVAGGNLDGFDIDAGSLSEITGSPFGDGASDFGQVAIAPDGSRLFASGQNGNNVHVFDIAANGALTEQAASPYPAGTFAWGTALTPDGRYLYVSNSNSNNISEYAVAADGSLAPLPGSPVANGSGTAPAFMGITSDGTHLYVANGDGNSVGAYSIGANGALTAVPSMPYLSGNSPWGVTIAPEGGHVYAGAELGNNVSGYSMAGTGALTPVAGSPFGAGVFTRQVAITPDGSLAFAGNLTSANISRYTRNETTGALSTIAPPIAAADGVTGLAITPNQPPPAQFNAQGVAGRTVAFRSIGLDPDNGGEPASFSWTFGDGTSVSGNDGGPDHEYAKDGTYDVKLIVADADGCGPVANYTGQTMYCNGGPIAEITKQVVVDTELLGPIFKAKKKQRQKKGKVVVKAKAGAAEDVLVSVESAKIKAGGQKLKLKKVKPADVKAGQLRKLKLKPSGKATTRRILAALADGEKVRAKFKVRLVDDAGFVAAKTLKVRLK